MVREPMSYVLSLPCPPCVVLWRCPPNSDKHINRGPQANPQEKYMNALVCGLRAGYASNFDSVYDEARWAYASDWAYLTAWVLVDCITESNCNTEQRLFVVTRFVKTVRRLHGSSCPCNLLGATLSLETKGPAETYIVKTVLRSILCTDRSAKVRVKCM